MSTARPQRVDRCPVCAATGVRAFHSISAAPVTCASIFDTPQAALAVPNGAVRLVVCQTCTFIYNELFDPALGAMSARYESSQAASAHFSSFAKTLAKSWIDRYALRGRAVLEVGCGGGDFLKVMLQQGIGRAIGIDPCAASANDDPARQFIADTFDERYLDLEADALVCRHTLEHIQDVGGFLGHVRDWAQRAPERVVLFELPGSERIFDERAFWDVYYEHCSYFTADTLRFAFERHGFELLRIEHAYDGQYLLVEAKVGGRTPSQPQVAQVTHRCVEFATDVAGSIDRFRERAEALATQQPPLVLWQGASKTVGLLTALDNPPWIECAVDLSPQRHGKYLPGSGLPVVAPAKLMELRPEHIVLMNPVYLTEVAKQVRDMGLNSQVRSVNDLLA
jgi:hypothetical protein